MRERTTGFTKSFLASLRDATSFSMQPEVSKTQPLATVFDASGVRAYSKKCPNSRALRSSARSLAQGPGNTRSKTASPGRATERRRISAARSGLQHPVTINLALARQAKILLPLRGSGMSKLEPAPEEEPNVYSYE
jgi:hypothetical protein